MRSKNRIIDLFKNRILKNMSENKIEFHFFFLMVASSGEPKFPQKIHL